MNDSTYTPTNQAMAPYSDDPTSSCPDTFEDENGTSKTPMQYFDIEVEEEDELLHDQLPSAEEVKANPYLDYIIRRKKRTNRNLLMMGIAFVLGLAITINRMTKKNNFQSAIISVTTTVPISHHEVFFDPDSPQSKALQWMIEEDPLALPLPSSESDPFVQRYAIAVMVFALTTTNTKTSSSQTNTRQIFHLLSGSHECEWNSEWFMVGSESENGEPIQMGVICEDKSISDLSVTEISFPSAGLLGVLPLELGVLSRLRNFDMADNEITGSIPPMPQLRTLDLSRNQISGSLPEHLSAMTYLTRLSLSENAITGILPENFASLTYLQSLDLAKNKLKGGLDELYSLTNIEELYLAENKFGDRLSQSSFQELSNLRVLDAKDNRLSGPIPNSLWQLTHLEVVDLYHNSLDGHIEDIVESNRLKYLDVSKNLLGGGLPTSIGNLGSLTHLDVSYNRFESPLPGGYMAELTNLKTLLLVEDDDMGVGPLPLWLREMTNLEQLSFRLSTRTGTIPTWFGELTKLELLDLDWNHISGTVPTELGLLTNLKYLMLNRNFLTGTVPTEVTYLPALQILMLDTNSFEHEILVGDEQSCEANGAGRIKYMIADCGDSEDEASEKEVDCPCCTSCCSDALERCNMEDWTLIVEEEFRGTYNRYSDKEISFVPVV